MSSSWTLGVVKSLKSERVRSVFVQGTREFEIHCRFRGVSGGAGTCWHQIYVTECSMPASAAIMRWFSRSFVVLIIAWSSRKPSAWRTPRSAAHTAARSSGGMPPLKSKY